jgi:hypothetical protein
MNGLTMKSIHEMRELIRVHRPDAVILDLLELEEYRFGMMLVDFATHFFERGRVLFPFVSWSRVDSPGHCAAFSEWRCFGRSFRWTTARILRKLPNG